MYVVELSGLTCSGKNTVAEYIAGRVNGAYVVDASKRVLLPEANMRGIPVTRSSLTQLYMGLGLEVYHRVRKIAEEMGARVLITPNGRCTGTKDFFEENGDEYNRFIIWADDQLRLERRNHRERPWEPRLTSVAQLRDVDSAERDATGLGEILRGGYPLFENNYKGLDQLDFAVQENIGSFVQSELVR